MACVVTKTDLYPSWRRILELDRGHLAAAGIGAELFAVSSTLRWHAVLENDAEANAESGFPELIGYLRKRVLGQADRLARRGVAHDVLAVTDQLVGNLRAEQSAQQNPEEVQRLVRTLTEAQERATALKERSARWQQTLNDGVADLNADIDYDLRDRMREISRMAEEELLARRPGEGLGPVRELGAAGGRLGRVGQLHLGHPARPLAGPPGRRALRRRPRPAAARAAQRSVRRAALGAPDGRPGQGRRSAWATRR